MKKDNKLDIFSDNEESELLSEDNEIKDSLYYEQQLKKILFEEEQERLVLAGEKWLHVGGRIYKLSRLFFYLITIWTMFFNLVLILGWVLNIETIQDAINNLTITSVFTVLLLVSLLLMTFKKPKILPIIFLSTPTAIASVVVFWRWYSQQSGTLSVTKASQNNDYAKFIICNLPVVLIPICAIIMFMVIFLDERYSNKVFDRTVRRILLDNKSEESIMSNETWVEILKDYIIKNKNKRENNKHKLSKK